MPPQKQVRVADAYPITRFQEAHRQSVALIPTPMIQSSDCYRLRFGAAAEHGIGRNFKHKCADQIRGELGVDLFSEQGNGRKHR